MMTLADETLGGRVEGFLRTCGFSLPRHNIRVIVRDGVVHLSGWVAEQIDVQVVATLVGRLDEIVRVDNELVGRTVEPEAEGLDA